MMKPERQDAILSLAPGAKFSYSGDTLKWDSPGITQPTTEAIAAELTKLETEYTNKKYQRDRQAAYPALADQLDMQYWDKKNGTNKWVEAIDKVKSDNPKS